MTKAHVCSSSMIGLISQYITNVYVNFLPHIGYISKTNSVEKESFFDGSRFISNIFCLYRNTCNMIQFFTHVLVQLLKFHGELFDHVMFNNMLFMINWRITRSVSLNYFLSFRRQLLSRHDFLIFCRKTYIRYKIYIRSIYCWSRPKKSRPSKLSLLLCYRIQRRSSLFLTALRIDRKKTYIYFNSERRSKHNNHLSNDSIKPLLDTSLHNENKFWWIRNKKFKNSFQIYRGPKPFKGGSKIKLLDYDFLKPYVQGEYVPTNQQHKYKFVTYAKINEVNQYLSTMTITCDIPLKVLFNNITLETAREIAAIHGISAGSRCSLQLLLSHLDNHFCSDCLDNVSVFSIEKSQSEKNTMKVAQYRGKQKELAAQSVQCDQKPMMLSETPLKETQKTYNNQSPNQSLDVKNNKNKLQNKNKQKKKIETEMEIELFPPEPFNMDLFQKINNNVCKKMSTFEEEGCAVCGQLTSTKELSRLKHVKKLLDILKNPGVTRLERKTKGPLKEYNGPVLDYQCNKICNLCRSDLRKKNIPRLALTNNLWLGEVPAVLKNLRYVEKLLIQRIRHTCCFVKVASGQKKMKANIIAFQSPIPKVYKILPPPREDMDDVLAIMFTGKCKPTPEDLKRTPFLVRRNYVINALEWLKINHQDYEDIDISSDNINSYPEDTAPVVITYQETDTNKVPEGTSVFDMEIEDGAESGECPFTVHGLTGEMLNTMSVNSIKAMALRHLNNNGKILAVGQSSKYETMYDNPQLYPQMFPWLFPYGTGGIGTSSTISESAHIKFLLMYHDKRFQTDVNFPFVAFCHEQVKCATWRGKLLADQSRFDSIADRLLNVNQNVLEDLTLRLEKGDLVKPSNDAEKTCYQIIQDLDHIAGKVNGSITSKKYMRNEIWSLIYAKSAPLWYFTLSPADIQHPICISYASTDKTLKFPLPYDERMRLVCRNPVAGARFFHSMVKLFITEVLGVGTKRKGLYGNTDAYYGTVEQQGRLTLHLHMMIWIKSSLTPQEIRDKILDVNSDFRKKMIEYLESCFSGDFMTGNKETVANKVAEESSKPDYQDPTQTLPEIAPSSEDSSLWNDWYNRFKTIVDDLLLKSNLHDCDRGINKDGSRNKKSSSANCKDNKWGKCKARFPRSLFAQTEVDEETGAINMKKSESWINTFTYLITYLFRCNTDVTNLSSGTAIKAVVLYVSDYITKTTLKTHTIFDSIRAVFQKNTELLGGTIPMREKARRLMTKVVNLLSAKMEMGAPMICMYLLNNPDHYTDHKFIPFYWYNFVQQARSCFDNEKDNQKKFSLKVQLIKKQGRIIGLSPVFDYIYRGSALEDVTLYDWVTQYHRAKFVKDPEVDDLSNTDFINNYQLADNKSDRSVHNSTNSEDESVEIDPEEHHKFKKNQFEFQPQHPLYRSHCLQKIKANNKIIPNFIGPPLPRCDQGDRELFCSTMLCFFKPWRTGLDLKLENKSWDESYDAYSFTTRQQQIIKNFNIKHECLDARDDYRAQLKAGAVPPIFGSWDTNEEDSDNTINEDTANNALIDQELSYHDVPDNLDRPGTKALEKNKTIKEIRDVLFNVGWDQENTSNNITATVPFMPSKLLSGAEWRNQVIKKRQELLDKRNEFNLTLNTLNDDKSTLNIKTTDTNTVKIVDKSYLERNFDPGPHKAVIAESITKFSLNTEQERAFRIVANHAVDPHAEQLKMYLGGMGGTGKSQVLKALGHFFSERKESHRFLVVAPTGTAAALLGGSTYHYMFGINSYSDGGSFGGLPQIKSRLAGVEYVFLDEVSMLSARDLYKISFKLCQVFNTPDIPFGGINIVFAGDFAQLPPAIGGEHISLYSRSIGTHSTKLVDQEQAIGKALWHQITTVVILRQNMRQRSQSADDNKFRTALENMRYKACTPDNIAFLKTRVSSNIPGRPNICTDNFRNEPIITATNIHKDEINRIGALRFAKENNLKLTDFFSEDSLKINTRDEKFSKTSQARIYLESITDGIQDLFWNQPPSSTDKHIAGKLSLCVGMPIMIRHNFATELCITKGQEGFVQGWQSKVGSRNQLMLDTLFIKLKNPPSTVQFDGLPENVVPITPTTNVIHAYLPCGKYVVISRTQVEVLVNYAMTDYASQGKTRPQNPTDLNNLRTHQAYYTALSRSATAEGTVILQGFSANKIVGGASGALRQEFRELELLDEITRLQHESKLSALVIGDTRNVLIKTFRAWKGTHYVPSKVHPAIRWSKKDPLYESNTTDLPWKIVKKDKDNKVSSIIDAKLVKEEEIKNIITPVKKPGKHILVLTPNNSPSTNHVNKKKYRPVNVINQNNQNDYHPTFVPIGFKWSNNSCAFDALLTILYSIWNTSPEQWALKYREFNSESMQLLGTIFHNISTNNYTILETERDKFRHNMANMNPTRFAFGQFISATEIAECLLFDSENVYYKRIIQCDDHGLRRQYRSKSCYLNPGTRSFDSINNWINDEWPCDEVMNSCNFAGCEQQTYIIYEFQKVPEMLAFDITSFDPTIDISFKIWIKNEQVRFRLAGILYYGHSHFTSRILTQDKQLWFHDGITTGNQLNYEGSWFNLKDKVDLNYCNDNKASIVFYTKVTD